MVTFDHPARDTNDLRVSNALETCSGISGYAFISKANSGFRTRDNVFMINRSQFMSKAL
jgi:hypothetical protein